MSASLVSLVRDLVAWWITYVRFHLAAGLAAIVVLALVLAVVDHYAHRSPST